jgi:hypothetical protein
MSGRPVLVIHARHDVADDWLEGHLEAARAAFGGAMDVVAQRGPSGDPAAFAGRDVVFWPWLGSKSAQRDLGAFAGIVARTAARVRMIAPADEADRIGPAGLNGHAPVPWARKHCVEIEPSEAVDLDAAWFGDDGHVLADVQPEAEPERYVPVSEWVPPDVAMLEGPDWPEPTNFLEEAPLPKLEARFLPSSLTTFIFDQSQIIGSDPCILAISTLVACAAATSDTIKLQPKQYEHGWKESARLWGAFVGDPSVKKTPPLNRATSHLRKLDIEFAEDAAERMQRFKIAKRVYEAQEKRYIDASAKGNRADPLPEPPERPPQRRIIVQDATIEAVSDVLADNPQGILVLFDELSGFFGSMDAYRGGAGSKDRSFWLEAYNGGPRRVDRITREARHVPNLSCCILGGIQPSAIKAKAGEMVEDGLLQRFMIVCAEGGSSVGEDRAADTEALHRYRYILDRLVKESGDPEAPVLFDDEALAVFRRTELKLNGFVREDRLPLRMRLQLGKWSGLFARLCLTYWAIECAAVDLPVAGRITADIAERVEALLFEYLFWHLKWFYEGVCGDSTNSSDAARKVALWILAKQPQRITSSILSHGVRGWRSLAWKTRRDVMDTLETCGWVMAEPRRAGAAPSWIVNAVLFERFSAIAEAEQKRRADIVDAIMTKTEERRESRKYE